MKSKSWLALLVAILAVLIDCFAGVAAARAQAYTPPASNHVDFNFNYDWLFIKQNAAGASGGDSYNDSSWTPVSLPHTWNNDKFREWIFLTNATPQDPLLPNGTYYGIAWYRKHFTLPTLYSGRKIILEFQGIGRVGTFYVNGQYVGLNESGVAPVGIDITPYVTFGSDNVIAVEVNNDENYQTLGYNGVGLPFGQPFNPNFGGLNRDVTLHICDLLHQTFPLYRNLGTVGTYVYPTGIDTYHKTAGLTIQTQVENDYSTSQSVTCSAVVVDNSNNVVLSATAAPQTFTPGQISTVTLTGSMTNIHFWSPDYPYLYQVYTILSAGTNVTDVYQTPLGVRTFVFGPTFGLEVNGHPLYLNGYSPRCSMEWPCVGAPVDWMNDYDFRMMKAGNANFVRPMHIAPRKVQVQAADKFGLVMVCPAANNEGDDTDPNIWQERLDDMRDVTIYYRNDPSVLFYEGCNQILTAQHMTDMLNVRLTWDPYGGRLAGCRSNDTDVTYGIREYSCTMDGAGQQAANPLWDAEYGRGESPRRVWDEYTPMLNPRWDGVNRDPTPYYGANTTSKYLIGGYFYIASAYHQAFGLNSGVSDFIGDFLTPATTDPSTSAYFRLQSSEDMVLENLAKYYARQQRSVFLQAPATSAAQGVMVGGGKIIWSDSVTDGRMHDMEVARVSGAVDGARLPKELYYALQTAQSPTPSVYIVGHWNYAPGTVKTVYVVSNTSQVDLQTYDTDGALIKDYGLGTQNFLPASLYPTGGDMVNYYVFAFPNVQWQAGSIKAYGYNSTSTAPVASFTKSTAGAPVALRLTPTVGPNGFMADGSDIAMFDVEVIDASGNRCPTYTDAVTFNCSGQGVFLGGYNSGVRYSTNLTNATSGYNLDVECGINRVFVRSTRTPGPFTLNVTGSGLAPASATVNSTAVADPNGLSTAWPQVYQPTLGTEPAPVVEGTPPPPPANAPNPAPATNVVDLHYSGANQDQAVLVENVQPGMQVYKDASGVTFGSLPGYLIGGEFIEPFQGDAGDTSATDQYQFNITDYSYIYLLIDAANGMPDNDNNSNYQWQELSDTVTINGRVMNVYKSRLMKPYENGYLADNGYGTAPFDPSSNMYLVFIVSAEEQLQNPSDTITASTSQSSSMLPPMAIDGNVNTRWNASSGAVPQEVDLDLGRVCNIGGYQMNWYESATRYYQYKIQISTDGTNYNTSLDMSANVNIGDLEYRVPALDASTGRYLKITVNGASPGAWAAISEMAVYGVVASGTQSAASAPVINSALAASGSGGYAFNYQISATNSPTGYNAQGLPSGLSVNGVTGLISGITLQSGTFPITITGINSAGPGSAVLTLVMTPPPPIPVIGGAPTLSATAGIAIPTYQIVASNLPTGYNATSLPSGLSVSTSTGKITGTPKYPGTYNVGLQASNAGGTGTAVLTVFVAPNGPPPAITSSTSSAGTAGSTYSYQIVATNTSTLFSATGLPNGVSLNTSTGALSGTPTVPGTYTVTITASNTGGTTTTTLVITVAPNPAAPVITSVLSGTGAVGIPYSYAIAATNNPTSYSAVGLPAGLNITSTNGIIAGTPTTAGTSNVTIEAINSSGIGPATFVMTVLPATKPPVFTSGTNVAGDAGLAFNDQVTVTNTPVTFAATGLPGGIGINPSTGFVSGTPTVSGTFIATVTASNIAGTGTSNLNFILGAPGADINLALNHSASVSSTENATNLGPDAVDGNTATRWESLWSDPQWFYVDLGAEQTVHSVVIDWENASGKDYLIQTSDDGYTWSVVESVTNNTLSGVLTYPGINTHARYVRMSGTQRTTIYGYSIWEFQVLGLPNQSGTTPPVITSGTVATGAEGSPFGYQVTATNSPTSYNAVGLPPGLSINPGTGAITGTAAASGTCAVIISGSNAAGVGATQLFLTTLPPFTAWQNQVFTQSALSDPAVSGMTASPANDGIPNLMKYALHINPNVNGAGGLPAVSNSSAGGQEYLTLTYTQVIAASDITYTVEVSGDMQTWSSGPGYTTTVSVTNNPDGVTQTVVARDMTPEASAYNRYIRLKVTMP